MFSFFDNLRRRTCDSVLAGMHDAFELIETRNAEEQAQTAESLLAKFEGGAEPIPPASTALPVTRPAPSPPPPSRPTLPTPALTPGGASLEPRKRGRPPKSPGGPT